MTTTINKPFIRFAGDCWLNGKAVVVYGDAAVVQIRAETFGGKHVPGTRVEEMPLEKYEALREEWSEGCINRDDVRIQQRALRYLGLEI